MAPIAPKCAWINVNRRCNLRCRWCYSQGTGFSTNDDMPLQLARQLIETVQGCNVQTVLFIGGEPTLWPHLLTLNRECRERQLRTTLVTNALRFGDDRYWEQYQTSPNDNVGISLKAGTPEQLLNVAGVTAFKDVERGIQRATARFNCGVSITYNTFYRGTLPTLARFAVDCGATSVKIDFCSTVFVEGRASELYMVPPQELVADIIGSYQELLTITQGNLAFEMELPLCMWPTDFIEMLMAEQRLLTVCQLLKHGGLVFSTDGSLLLCNALFDYLIGKFSVDFCNTASLQSFLTQPTITEHYERIRCYPSPDCAECDWYAFCGGGCPLRWAIYKPEDIIKPRHQKGDMGHGEATGAAQHHNGSSQQTADGTGGTKL